MHPIPHSSILVLCGAPSPFPGWMSSIDQEIGPFQLGGFSSTALGGGSKVRSNLVWKV